MTRSPRHWFVVPRYGTNRNGLQIRVNWIVSLFVIIYICCLVSINFGVSAKTNIQPLDADDNVESKCETPRRLQDASVTTIDTDSQKIKPDKKSFEMIKRRYRQLRRDDPFFPPELSSIEWTETWENCKCRLYVEHAVKLGTIGTVIDGYRKPTVKEKHMPFPIKVEGRPGLGLLEVRLSELPTLSRTLRLSKDRSLSETFRDISNYLSGYMSRRIEPILIPDECMFIPQHYQSRYVVAGRIKDSKNAKGTIVTNIDIQLPTAPTNTVIEISPAESTLSGIPTLESDSSMKFEQWIWDDDECIARILVDPPVLTPMVDIKDGTLRYDEFNKFEAKPPYDCFFATTDAVSSYSVTPHSSGRIIVTVNLVKDPHPFKELPRAESLEDDDNGYVPDWYTNILERTKNSSVKLDEIQ